MHFAWHAMRSNCKNCIRAKGNAISPFCNFVATGDNKVAYMHEQTTKEFGKMNICITRFGIRIGDRKYLNEYLNAFWKCKPVNRAVPFEIQRGMEWKKMHTRNAKCPPSPLTAWEAGWDGAYSRHVSGVRLTWKLEPKTWRGTDTRTDGLTDEGQSNIPLPQLVVTGDNEKWTVYTQLCPPPWRICTKGGIEVYRVGSSLPVSMKEPLEGTTSSRRGTLELRVHWCMLIWSDKYFFDLTKK